jgi:hypothetical protein
MKSVLGMAVSIILLLSQMGAPAYGLHVPYTGAFREVTFEPPNPKPNLTFVQLEDKPEIFSRLTQIRTMHGYNVSYFNRFHIEHEPECLCTEIIPPVPPSRIHDHIFHNCEEYQTHRYILTAVNRQHSPTILLSGNKGILAVAKFIELTGAFSSTGKPVTKQPFPDLPGLDLTDIENTDPATRTLD